jgi:hypothetical protein
MPNEFYIRAASQERTILEKWRRMGYDGVRAAGSHGIDVTVWNENEFIFNCHKLPEQYWHPNEMEEVLKMKRPPNSKVYFWIGTSNTGFIGEKEATRQISAYRKTHPNEQL